MLAGHSFARNFYSSVFDFENASLLSYSRNLCAARVRDGRRRARCASSAFWRFISVWLTPLCFWLQALSLLSHDVLMPVVCCLPARQGGAEHGAHFQYRWPCVWFYLSGLCVIQNTALYSHMLTQVVCCPHALRASPSTVRLFMLAGHSFARDFYSSVFDFANASLLMYPRKLCAARVRDGRCRARCASSSFLALHCHAAHSAVFLAPHHFGSHMGADAGCVLPACAAGPRRAWCAFSISLACVWFWLTGLCVLLHTGVCSHMLTQVVCCPHALRASPSTVRIFMLAGPSLA